jgi:hypothetical protein
MRTSTAGVVFSMLTVLGMGCAARGAQIQHAPGPGARPDCIADSKVCSPPWLGSKLARREVMTWREYYTSVMNEAFRRNSAVIWINPPKPIANVALSAVPPDIAPTGLGR